MGNVTYQAVLVFLCPGDILSTSSRITSGFVRIIFMCPDGHLSPAGRGISISFSPGRYCDNKCMFINWEGNSHRLMKDPIVNLELNPRSSK
jgi:hypothetical protein